MPGFSLFYVVRGEGRGEHEEQGSRGVPNVPILPAPVRLKVGQTAMPPAHGFSFVFIQSASTSTIPPLLLLTYTTQADGRGEDGGFVMRDKLSSFRFACEMRRCS